MNAVSRRLWRESLATWLLALCLPGCGDVLGPEEMPVTTVQGKVSEGRRPISRGWIEFVPVDGTVGSLRSAPLRADGTFHATKVPVGLNLIRLVNVDIEPKKIRQIFGAFSSPIRRRISANGESNLEIDVVEESLKLTRSKPKQEGIEPTPDRGAR